MERKEIVRALLAFDYAVWKAIPKGEQSLTPLQVWCCGHFSGVRGLALACSRLIQYRQSAEAEVLLRPMMERALRLMYLERCGPIERVALFAGHWNDSYEKWINHISEAERLGIESDPGPAIESLRKRQDALKEFAGRNGVSRFKRFPSEKQMASAVERHQAYLDHTILSNDAIHGSAAWHMPNEWRGELLAWSQPGTNDQSADTVSEGVLDWYAGALKASASLMGWSLGDLGEALSIAPAELRERAVKWELPPVERRA